VKFPVLTSLLILALACTKEEKPAGTSARPAYPGCIVINEMVTAGSQQVNEFGDPADWIELYAPGNDFLLEAGKWFVTDDLSHEPMKYELPEVLITSEGFLVVWCDGENTDLEGIHTNFRLSGNDGTVALVYFDGHAVVVMNEVPISDAPGPHVSMGRAPDGTDTWVPLAPPTPGGPNEPVGSLNN
jgi:hypothetical protein